MHEMKRGGGKLAVFSTLATGLVETLINALIQNHSPVGKNSRWSLQMLPVSTNMCLKSPGAKGSPWRILSDEKRNEFESDHTATAPPLAEVCTRVNVLRSRFCSLPAATSLDNETQIRSSRPHRSFPALESFGPRLRLFPWMCSFSITGGNDVRLVQRAASPLRAQS